MIYVFLAPGFEEIEALAVVDVLRRAELDVITVGVGEDFVIGSHGIPVAADIYERDLILDEKVEAIVLPGGMPGTLDLEKSSVVQKAIDNLMQDRTVFVIAHRLSTVVNADKIIVLKNGKILEMEVKFLGSGPEKTSVY